MPDGPNKSNDSEGTSPSTSLDEPGKTSTDFINSSYYDVIYRNKSFCLKKQVEAIWSQNIEETLSEKSEGQDAYYLRHHNRAKPLIFSASATSFFEKG